MYRPANLETIDRLPVPPIWLFVIPMATPGLKAQCASRYLHAGLELSKTEADRLRSALMSA